MTFSIAHQPEPEIVGRQSGGTTADPGIAHEVDDKGAVPALREYFCDPLMMIALAYAHAPVRRSDLPLGRYETIAGRVKRRRRNQ